MSPEGKDAPEDLRPLYERGFRLMFPGYSDDEYSQVADILARNPLPGDSRESLERYIGLVKKLRSISDEEDKGQSSND